MKIWATSDTHGYLPEAPKASDNYDLAIIAGDFCADHTGYRLQLAFKQWQWLVEMGEVWLRMFPRTLPVVLIWGNHDFVGQDESLMRELVLPNNVHVLTDRAVTVEGVTIYGTPWSISPPGWAFRTDEGEYKERLENAPEKIDILVTHGPPAGPAGQSYAAQLGSTYLHDWIVARQIPNVVCGHIHEAFGLYEPTRARPYLLANVARCDVRNRPVNKPVELEIEVGEKEEVKT